MLGGKKILLGVCGSIAAYKAAFFVRLLVKSGAEVRVIMTSDATQFIGPLTLSTLSKNKVYTSFTTESGTDWNNHVELALWADLFIIAPASANTIAKMATGICDNLLLATYFSAKREVAIAPAMDLDMYQHPTLQQNLERLRSFGNTIIPANAGELASGLMGEGRMAEPEELLKFVKDFFSRSTELKGKTAIVTSGPTREAIDPVRYITNHSTGKMGKAMAEELAARGARVIFITGPAEYLPHPQNIQVEQISTAEEMLTAASARLAEAHIVVAAAAVADFAPEPATSKIKKSGDGSLTLHLKPTKDILATLAAEKKDGQVFVGFALETDDEEANAKRKLKAKNLDLIVLNSLREKGSGFGHDTNQVTIFSKNNKTIRHELKPKFEVARDIVDQIVQML